MLEISTKGISTTKVINTVNYYVNGTTGYKIDRYTVFAKKVKFKLTPKPSKEKLDGLTEELLEILNKEKINEFIR